MRLFCKCGSRISQLGKLWLKILMTIVVIYCVVSALKYCAVMSDDYAVKSFRR